MSLGLIVAVVFAIVLLSLAITWIQGMIGNISGITEDLTQQASTELRNTFADTNSNFAVWPTDYKIERGNGIQFLAGIKNRDSVDHDYVINMIPAGASSAVCDTGEVKTCMSNVMTTKTVYDYVKSWVTVETTVSTAHPLDESTRHLTVEVPTNAEPGYYLFNAIACYDVGGTPVSSQCFGNSDNLWSTAQSVTIHVPS